MYFVYILRSKKSERYYIGHTSNIVKRLKGHNSGKVKSTKAYAPWEVVYSEQFGSKSKAFQRT